MDKDTERHSQSMGHGKDQKFKPSYRIGELSHILGMHPQSVRYYNRVGIVHSSKKDGHREKLYASYDAYKIMVRKQYSNMGFSISETERAFSTFDLASLQERLNEKKRHQQEELQAQTLIYQGVDELSQLINHIPLLLNRCYFKLRPARWHHRHLEKDQLEEGESAINARQIAMRSMPLARHSVVLQLRDIEKSPLAISNHCDLIMEAKDAESFGFNQLTEAFYIDKAPCIYTVCRIPEYSSVSWLMLDYVQTFMQAQGLTLAGDVEAVTILNALRDSETTEDRYRYFEVWIPIKELSFSH